MLLLLLYYEKCTIIKYYYLWGVCMLASSKTALTAAFLQQSLLDCMDDYKRSLKNASFPHWDAVIITASNEQQALGYQKQIDYRKKEGRLPQYTEFIIVPDRYNRRVGSAGSTLSVIQELKERYSTFEGKRFLCIHAGGDSKRCPQYSALGKLFSPIPMCINGQPATIFDMFLQTMASIPSRMRDGMLLLSGDVILLFNPLMCDFGASEASVISFKEDVQTGKNHGVYLRSDSGYVKRFLHKLSEERLRELGAVDERGNCSIDTGAMQLSPVVLNALHSLVNTDEKYNSMVNDRVRLSLYGDIAYCLAEDSTLQDFFLEKPEGEYCEELKSARTALWQAISSYRMKLLNLAPAKFVHFGSIPEILRLLDSGVEEFRSLGWNRQTASSMLSPEAAGYCSVLSPEASVGEGVYLEVSYVHSKAKIGNHCYVSFTDLHDELIPDDTVLHCLKLQDGRFVCRMFGTEDNPKENKLFGQSLMQSFFAADTSLWEAEIYPVCGSIREAVSASLNVYELMHGRGNFTAWQSKEKISLKSGFAQADPQAILDWQIRMADLVRMEELSGAVLKKVPVREVVSLIPSGCLSKIQQQWLEEKVHTLNCTELKDFSYAMRLWYYLGIALDDEQYTAKCFHLIADTVLDSTLADLQYNENAKIVHDETAISLPLRVNFGGGWTDTAPHCLENGGVVLNAAISLNGELPVEVRLAKIPELKIVFDSRDMDVHGEFTDIEPLQNTGDPFEPFALQKACLLACGILPKEGGDLSEILSRLGGGFEMHSEVTKVPKGSGLGTSSILSAAAVKAVLEFTGIPYDEEKLYSTVLAMEQLMSTGGGWQDQVGGLIPGLKLISSEPGLKQHLKVDHVALSDAVKQELNARFAIIYTGQRRLARNLLRDVIGRYLGNEPDSLYAHKEIQKTAALMRFALERGDVDEFASLLDHHWALSKMIDAGSSNTLIEQIFMAIDDLIDARMVCGAGGGGFLQVILKKDVTKAEVHDRLKEVFQDFDVDVWPCEIVY